MTLNEVGEGIGVEWHMNGEEGKQLVWNQESVTSIMKRYSCGG